MANNNNLKTSIQGLVKTNGNREITGQIMQNALIAIINHFGFGSVFGGIAVPNTNPSNSDVNLIYFATQPGTYSNFGGYVHTGGLVMFSNISGSWVGSRELDTKSIVGIEKISTVGYTDTYRISFSDETFYDFTVTNGGDAKISDWVAGSYPALTLKSYNGKIYRSKVTTSNAPTNSAGVINVDWEMLGGGQLDQAGGALSFERGSVLEQVLDYFLTVTELTPGPTATINKSSAAYSGITPLENTGLWTNGTTFGYDQDFRLFTYLNIPTVRSDGRKMMRVRFNGEIYAEATMSNLIGVRQDNSLVPLITGEPGGGMRDVTINVVAYKAIHLSIDVALSTDNPVVTFTYSNETSSGAVTDSVKNYIDNAVKIKDWEPDTYPAGVSVTRDGVIYRSRVQTSQAPTPGATQWEPIGKDAPEYVETEMYDSSAYGIAVEGEFIKSTDFIRVVPGIRVDARGYGDGVRPFIEGYDVNKENPATLVSFEGRNATQPTDESVIIDFDGYVKFYNNTWQSGTNYFGKIFQTKELTRNDIGVAKGVASQDVVEDILSNKGGELVVKGSADASSYSVMDGEFWRWTPPIAVTKGNLIEAIGRGDTGAWSVLFSETPDLMVPGNPAIETMQTLSAFTGNGALDVMQSRAPSDGYIIARSNLFFGTMDGVGLKIMTDQLYLTFADVANLDLDGAGGLSNLTKLDIPEPEKLIKINFKTSASLPTAKGTVISGEFTYNDNAGTVFKKPGTLEVQGSSSAAYVKKNWTFAFFNDGELSDSCKIRLGKLVPHDEFVFKSNYIDATHSRNIVCNRIWEDMIQARPGMFKRENEIAKGFTAGNGTLIDRFDSGALCHVQGYPAAFYVNNEFYGIGTFNIGKKRDNYDIASNNQSQIQLAADDHANFNVWQGEPVWEIRRPGSPDAGFTARVTPWFTTNALPAADFKAQFNVNHDLINCIDYLLLIEFTYAYDCFAKNFILTSWKDSKFFFTPYDLDSTLGLSWEGRSQTEWTSSPRTVGGTASSQQFYQKLYTQFNAEVKARYKELKDKDVLTVDNVYRHLDHFAKVFGLDMYQQEFAKWPNIPSNNPNATGNPYGDGGFYTSKMQILNWVTNKIAVMDGQYL